MEFYRHSPLNSLRPKNVIPTSGCALAHLELEGPAFLFYSTQSQNNEHGAEHDLIEFPLCIPPLHHYHDHVPKLPLRILLA